MNNQHQSIDKEEDDLYGFLGVNTSKNETTVSICRIVDLLDATIQTEKYNQKTRNECEEDGFLAIGAVAVLEELKSEIKKLEIKKIELGTLLNNIKTKEIFFEDALSSTDSNKDYWILNGKTQSLDRLRKEIVHTYWS